MSKFNEIFGQVAGFNTLPEGGEGVYIEVTVHAGMDAEIWAGDVVVVCADEYKRLKSMESKDE